MALRGKRTTGQEDLGFFMNEVAERGGVVVASTVGSGEAMDQSTALVTYAADPSGKLPVGVLMQDVVNIDLTRQHLNQYSTETQMGGKVDVDMSVSCTTDMIYPGLTIAANQRAYLGPSGLLQNTVVNEVNNPPCGMFLSSKDEDGFAKFVFRQQFGN